MKRSRFVGTNIAVTVVAVIAAFVITGIIPQENATVSIEFNVAEVIAALLAGSGIFAFGVGAAGKWLS